jgi:hypothetical protein
MYKITVITMIKKMEREKLTIPTVHCSDLLFHVIFVIALKLVFGAMINTN